MAMCSCKVAEATLACTYCNSEAKMCPACYAAHQKACLGKAEDEIIFSAQHTEDGSKALIVIDNRRKGWPER